MDNISTLAITLTMLAGFLLLGGGVKFVLGRQTRGRGVLMIAAAFVLVTNVMIWTV